MRRTLLLALGVFLLVPGTLAAQRRGGGGGARPGPVPRYRTIMSGTNYPMRSLYSYGNSFYSNPYFAFPSSYGYSYPSFGYFQGPPGDYGTYVIAAAPDIPIEKRVVYVPTYLRADPGPSLGEIARALRAQRQARK